MDEIDRLNADLQEHVHAHQRLVQAYQRLEEEMAARAAAEHARSFLAAIVVSTDDAIIEENLNSIVQSWNPGAERLYGYSAEEMIGETISCIVPEEYGHEEAAILARIKRGERVEHYECIRRRKDGTFVPVSLTISPIKDAAGKIIGATKVARDLTAQRHYEEQRTLVAQLRRALADIKALRGMIPICAWCKKIRDDQQYWISVEEYITSRTDARFTHGMCPDCFARMDAELTGDASRPLQIYAEPGAAQAGGQQKHLRKA